MDTANTGRGAILRKRTVIQIESTMGGQSGQRAFYVLCDDGSMWQLISSEKNDAIRGIKTNWFLMDTTPIEQADI